MNNLPADGSGHWTQCRAPFLHIYAPEVFAPETYHRLSHAFEIIVHNTIAGTVDGLKMKKTNPNYDALVLAMNRDLSSQFAPLFTEEWKNCLAEVFDLPLTTRIDAALHHVPRGGSSGWLHTDLCSGWFLPSNSAETLVFPDRSGCDYFTGAPRRQGVHPEEFVRTVSMIYYLNNDGWIEGDGGETGLYSTSRSDVGPGKAVPPKSNTLVIFECSPHSFHRLIANPGRDRNSIVAWFHTTPEFAEARWPNAVSRERAS